MLKRKSHRINHQVGAHLRTTSPFGQRVNHIGRVTDVSISGMRIVVDQSSVIGVRPGIQARWRIRQKGALDLDGVATVVRSKDLKDRACEIALQFESLSYDVVKSLPKQKLVEIDVDLPLGADVSYSATRS